MTLREVLAFLWCWLWHRAAWYKHDGTWICPRCGMWRPT